MKEKELRKALMTKSKEQLVELYLQKKFDYEWLEQDLADCECLFAEANKALELICKEFNQDKYVWCKKAEHELYGGENNDVRE